MMTANKPAVDVNLSSHCDSFSSDVCKVLKQVKYQFAEMVPVRRMKWQNHIHDGVPIDEALQKRVLDVTINDKILLKYPPSLMYRRTFMKQFINMLEKRNVSVCDEVYDAFTALLYQDEDEDTLCYKTYYLTDEPITLQESVNLISQGTTGLSTWQAAQHLAEWCLENKQVFHNQNVLELGSGLGLTGLAVCQECNPAKYHFTDSHSQVLFLLAKNIERTLTKKLPLSNSMSPSPTKHAVILKKIRRQLSLNSDVVNAEAGCLAMSNNEISECQNDLEDFEVDSAYWIREDSKSETAFLRTDERLRILRLNWERVPRSVIIKVQPDVILAADVVYDTNIIPFLVAALSKIFSHSKCVAYIASTIRNDETRDQFLYALGTVDLKFEHIPSPVKQTLHYDRSIPIEIIRVFT